MYCRKCGEFMNDDQAICLKCGVPAGVGKSFCPHCGNAVAEEAVICVKCGVPLNTKGANTAKGSTEGIKERSLVTAILLSIVTCGIYGIFWFISLTNDMNKLSGNENDTNGGTAFLLNLVTCGIYGYFWAYKMGEKRDAVAGENASSNILYLIISIFGFQIVVWALMQDTINKAIANK